MRGQIPKSVAKSGLPDETAEKSMMASPRID